MGKKIKYLFCMLVVFIWGAPLFAPAYAASTTPVTADGNVVSYGSVDLQVPWSGRTMVLASNSGDLTLNGNSKVAVGYSWTDAIVARTGGVVRLNGSVDVIATNVAGAPMLHAEESGKIFVNGDLNVDIKGGDTWSMSTAIGVDGAVELGADSNTKITVWGVNNRGILVDSGGNMIGRGRLEIDMLSNDKWAGSHGIFVQNGTVDLNYGSATVINVAGDGSAGLYIEKDGKIASDGFLEIRAADTDKWAGAIRVIGGEASFGGTSSTDITTAGDGLDGVWVSSGGTFTDSGILNITTEGNYARALRTSGDSTIALAEGSETTIVTSGLESHGLFAQGGSISSSGDVTITTTANGSHGLAVQENGTVTLSKDSTIQIDTNGYRSHGFYGGGKIFNYGTADIITRGLQSDGYFAYGGELVHDGALTVVTLGEESRGIYADSVNSKSTIHFSGTADITTEGTSSHAVFARNSGDIVFTDSNVIVVTEGVSANGIRAENEGYVEMSPASVADITTKGTDAHGIVAFEDSRVALDGGVLVSTSGVGAHGVYSHYVSSVEAGNAVIETTGASAHGLFAEQSSHILMSGSVTTNSSDAFGVYARSNASVDLTGSVTTHGSNAVGLSANEASQLFVTGDVKTEGIGAEGLQVSGDSYALMRGNIATGGELAHAVAARNNSSVDHRGDYAITTRGANAIAVLAESGGSVLLDGNKIIAVDPTLTPFAIRAEGLSADALSRIAGAGVYDITGGMYAADHGQIEFNMADGSRFLGHTDVSEFGALSLDIAGANSRWTMTGDSLLTGLNLQDTAVVDMTAMPHFGRLTTQHLDSTNGSGGLFLMRTDVAIESADRLVVTQSTAGDHKINVQNQGGTATTGKERTILVETQNKGGLFSLANKDGAVDVGAWQYGLRAMNDGRGQFDGTDGQYWELHATGASRPASSAVNTFIGNYFLVYAETDTLIKRLGDLRSDLQYSKDGYWFRGFGGKMDSDSRLFVGEFDMDYWGVQVGYDNLLDREKSWLKNGDTYAGGYIGLSKGDLDFDQTGYGKGDIEHHTMGMYWTYIGDTGTYFDAIAKYVWSKNDFDVRDSAGSMVQGGRINTGGVGLSLETGKRIRFNDRDGLKPKGEQQGNWYMEPQGQLTWQHFSGGTFFADNGLKIGVDDYDSLIGRLGVLVGYEGVATNVYAKVFYLKEFQGDMKIYANDVYIYETLDDDWWVYGVGITHQLNARNSFYFDLERATGGDFDRDWNINAGWRISF